MLGDDFAGTADRVLLLPHRFDQLDHPPGGLGVGATHGRGFDLIEGDGERVGDVGEDLADLLDVAEDLDAVGVMEKLFGDGAGGDACDGLAGRGATAAAVIAEAELGVEGEVGVPGAVLVLDVAVVAGSLVLISDQHGDGGAGGSALEHAGEDLGVIRLITLRGDLRLPGPAALEIGQQVVLGERQSGRAAVDDDDVGGAVRLAGGGHAKQVAEGGTGHRDIVVEGVEEE